MLLCYYLLNSLLHSVVINNTNSVSFSNNIANIMELVANDKSLYKNPININYEHRIKSQKRIIEKLNKY